MGNDDAYGRFSGDDIPAAGDFNLPGSTIAVFCFEPCICIAS